MNMAVVSLIALAAAIVLGFVKKVNVGIVAIAMAYLIGIVYGIGAGKITGGFSSSMAMTMIGVMYLFAIVSGNGTLELLAKKITGLAGNRRYLLYVAVYAIGAILSGHDGRRSRIYHTAVSPDARGMGVGSLLVGHVIEALRTLGLPKVAVGVYADNEAGNEFWERQGFQVRNDLVYRELPL